MIMRGTLKQFDPSRKFGFIAVDRVGDALLHASDLEDYEQVCDQLVPGVKMAFWAVYKLRAPHAVLGDGRDLERRLMEENEELRARIAELEARLLRVPA